ncbi:zinc finger protein 664-like isoform X2 [Sipha flava]|nr:zinc finger protein 664-like isoform X2 [Sipha flava]XP_025411405.1 zinc finger protein 664-like isoform X2 [Sipha flava]XP_025411406.1 zinc finger protein 664-like isoform X2 [Sipha flava]XP_025411407.1 zinc finger protein 664-like isoform X2 [Sipha flava]XP_025411408.1 zinc finger protein 664-like isoform X2 [Sipha flava]
MSGNETAGETSTGNHCDAALASGSGATARSTRRTVAHQRISSWFDSDDTDREPSPCSSASWSPPRARRSPSVSMSSFGSPSPPPSPRLDSPSVEFECAVCSEAFQTKAEMKTHMQQSEGCGKQVLRAFRSKHDQQGFDAEQRGDDDHHREPPGTERPKRQLTCYVCERRFDRADQLAAHLRRKHGRPDVDCETCGQRFSRRTDLNRHRRAVHLRQRPHQCYDCGQRFAQKSNMLEHRRAVHAANPKVSFKCPRCDKWFSRKHNMTVHVRAVHDRQKRFKCPLCPRSYDQQSGVDKHYKALHAPATDGVPLFLCPVCGKRFSQKSNLTVHRRLHDPIQLLFACPVCHRSYTRKAALNKHACRPVEA